MTKLLVIGLGGFIGAIARYGLSALVHRRYMGAFPLGTLLVNVLGCLLIGMLMTLVEEGRMLSPNARGFLVIGLLGAMTTFSTLAFETFELLRISDFPRAFWNLAGSVLLGLSAVGLGRAIVRWL